jgi:hypothetical protein
VVLKLANFRSYDPRTTSKGMANAGRRTREAWERYADAPALLERVADAVRTAGDTAQIGRDELSEPEPDEQAFLRGGSSIACIVVASVIPTYAHAS